MLTEEEIAAAKTASDKELATQIHSAVATHMKGLQGKLMAELKTALPEMLAPTLAESMKAQFAEFQKAIPGGGGSAGGGGAAGDQSAGQKVPSPEFLAMQKRIDDIDRENKSNKQRADNAEQQAWKERSYAATQSYLQGKVKPELLDVVTDHLYTVKGLVVRHEDGSPVFKINKAPFAGMPEQEQLLPLESGVDEWLRSKDAQRFLPPPSPRGRGIQAGARSGVEQQTQGPQFTGEAKSGREKIHRSILREQHLAEQFPNLAKT